VALDNLPETAGIRPVSYGSQTGARRRHDQAVSSIISRDIATTGAPKR
jgi:hypothetical protein